MKASERELRRSLAAAYDRGYSSGARGDELPPGRLWISENQRFAVWAETAGFADGQRDFRRLASRVAKHNTHTIATSSLASGLSPVNAAHEAGKPAPGTTAINPGAGSNAHTPVRED